MKNYLKSLLFSTFLAIMFVINSFVGWFSPVGRLNNPVTYEKPINQLVPYTDAYTRAKVNDLSKYRLSRCSGRQVNDKSVS